MGTPRWPRPAPWYAPTVAAGAAVLLVGSTLAPPLPSHGAASGPSGALPAADCRLVLGFAALRDAIGAAIVGDCLEDEHFSPVNGNAEQRTTGGQLVWRKLDNWTAFTDGFRTWVSGPFGIQQRLNAERFAWENDPVAPLPGPPAAPTATPAPPALPTPTAVPPTPTTGGQVQPPPVEAALRDAASRLGVPADQLRLERVEAVEWRDSSLGCPQPGQFYLQVITPGYLVVISGAGRQLEYHTDERGRVVLCAQR